MFGLVMGNGTRGWHEKDESSGKSGPFLSKIEVSRIVDFGLFTKISQLLQCISCSILIIWTFSWTFWKGLEVLSPMPFVPCHFDLPISSYGLWLKMPFCWLLKMTYNVEIDNFLWEHFLDLKCEEEL